MTELAIYGGNFYPPGKLNHREIALRVSRISDKQIIMPCGRRTDGKKELSQEVVHRRALTELNFADIPNTEFDFSDLEREQFTPTTYLDRRYKEQYPEYVIRHVVGFDLVMGGSVGESQIQRTWVEGETVWNTLHFLVVLPADIIFNPGDFPPHYRLLIIPELQGRSTLVRQLLLTGQDEKAKPFLLPEVYAYIKQHRLFTAESIERRA